MQENAALNQDARSRVALQVSALPPACCLPGPVAVQRLHLCRADRTSGRPAAVSLPLGAGRARGAAAEPQDAQGRCAPNLSFHRPPSSARSVRSQRAAPSAARSSPPRAVHFRSAAPPRLYILGSHPALAPLPGGRVPAPVQGQPDLHSGGAGCPQGRRVRYSPALAGEAPGARARGARAGLVGAPRHSTPAPLHPRADPAGDRRPALAGAMQRRSVWLPNAL
jgi:hypothetical protein